MVLALHCLRTMMFVRVQIIKDEWLRGNTFGNFLGKVVNHAVGLGQRITIKLREGLLVGYVLFRSCAGNIIVWARRLMMR
mmetsp:Transcript_1375/g.5119  ORF Transcript_1375/g.5119 Transcript_1375/m.5119 type:complete len:80 (-) Transcript_1375:531-770(-)